MDFLSDILFNVLAHRVGVFILKALTGGRFKGESGFAWGWAIALGSFVLLAPFAAFIAWKIHGSTG